MYVEFGCPLLVVAPVINIPNYMYTSLEYYYVQMKQCTHVVVARP